MIDWQDITDGYNKQKQSNLTTKEMLEYLYRHMGSLRKCATYLGVSDDALAWHMDRLNVPRFRKGPWPGSLMHKFMAIPDKRFVELTARQISEILACQTTTVYNMAKKSGRLNYKHKNKRRNHVKETVEKTIP